MDQKTGNLARKIPRTWMFILQNMVWIGMVSHCITLFLPIILDFSLAMCHKDFKIRRSTAKSYRIGLWTARWQDPHAPWSWKRFFFRNERTWFTIFSPVPQGWLDPNLLWRTQTVQRMPSCAGLLVLRFWKLYEIYESWMCCLERIWTNFKKLFVNLRIEDTLNGEEQPVPTRPDSCRLVPTRPDSCRHLENGVCVLVRRRRLHCRWVGLPLPKIRLSAVEASEVRQIDGEYIYIYTNM